ALATAVAITSLGKNGVPQMAYTNMQKARYMKNQLEEAGFTITFKGAFFNELVVEMERPIKEVNEALLQNKIIGGYDLSDKYDELNNHMLIAVTEIRSKDEIDHFVKELRDINGN